jgi:hypothetical protein
MPRNNSVSQISAVASRRNVAEESPVEVAIDLAFLKCLEESEKQLLKLDPSSEERLWLLVEVLMRGGVQQGTVAEAIDVSRTTISRWVSRQKMPRNDRYRKSLSDGMAELLSQHIEVARKRLKKARST